MNAEHAVTSAATSDVPRGSSCPARTYIAGTFRMPQIVGTSRMTNGVSFNCRSAGTRARGTNQPGPTSTPTTASTAKTNIATPTGINRRTHTDSRPSAAAEVSPASALSPTAATHPRIARAASGPTGTGWPSNQ